MSERRCIFVPCVATWRHWHGGFPGGYDNPDDPTGPPIPFEGDDPEPTAVRDYNGAALSVPDPRTAEERLRAALEVISTGSHPDGHRGAVLVARAALAVEPVPVPLAHDDVPYPEQCQTCVDAHYAALATPPEPEP